jgi:hypothetical protein
VTVRIIAGSKQIPQVNQITPNRTANVYHLKYIIGKNKNETKYIHQNQFILVFIVVYLTLVLEKGGVEWRVFIRGKLFKYSWVSTPNNVDTNY